MRVLVACEFSGRVRDAFARRGHDAWSCDLIPSEAPGNHIQGDVLKMLAGGWDLMIAHPPCTHLAAAGARWWAEKGPMVQWEALEFVRALLAAPIPKIALENPVGKISTSIRQPDQIVQPWQFGHPETKATCLWLKGLAKLEPTKIVEPDFMRKPDGSFWLDRKGKKCSRIHWMSGRMKDADRARVRSLTCPGIAEAMAEQWGSLNG